MSEWADTPNVFERTVRRVIATRPAAWLLARTGHHLDNATLRLSGGRVMASVLVTGLPIIALTTTGARSGRPRTVPLVGIPDGDRLILIASNWGQAKHPAWYYNVRATPQVTITHNGQTRPYVAREVMGEERERCWAKAVALYPGYRGYAARAGRGIPVVVVVVN
jgi:deazaflavin-dependent oxidoreductase (nitroreductase family)